MKRKMLGYLLLFSLFMGLVTGCTTKEPPAPPKPEKEIGGKIIFATAIEPTTLDPQLSTDLGVARLIFGSIMGIDEQGAYYPFLAEEVVFSGDALTCTIKFRKGLKWHNGTDFHASDFVYTLNEATKKRGVIRNLMMGYKGAEALDDLTVRINFSMANASFQYALTTPYLSPQPEKYIKEVGAEAFARKPVGLGMFKFSNWVVGTRLTLITNRDFTALPEGRELPYIEEYEYRFIAEDATRLAAMTAGEIEYTYLNAIQVSQFEDTTKYRLVPRKAGGLGQLVLMNLEKEPFGDINVRKAINYAVDRQAMLKVVARDRGEILYGPLRPSTIGYTAEVEKIGYGFDLGKVDKLMADAGYEKKNGVWTRDGKALEFTIITDALFATTTEVLQKFLSDAGFKASIEQVESGVLIDNMAEGNYEMSVYSASWADAVLLFGFFHSSSIGFSNYSRLSIPEIDSALIGTFGAASRAALEENAAIAQKLIVEGAYTVPLFTNFSDLVIHNRVKGYTTTPTGDLILFGCYIKR